MKNSDICLSIRNVWSEAAGEAGSLQRAEELIAQLRPTRIEWSYVKDPEKIARLTKGGAVFVATLNTISPPGNARSFEGEPIVAPWMKKFSTPSTRPTYMCQNNPADVQARIDQALQLVEAGATCFQHDDWYCNAQVVDFGNPCFCGHCMAAFAEDLGIDLDYRSLLRRRGVTHTAEVLDLARRGELPLWEDYVRFQKATVGRYFRKLRANMDRFCGGPATLSVNGSAAGFGGDIHTILPFLSYFNGETHDFTPAGLGKLAAASRKAGRKQVVSFFPDVPANALDSPGFVRQVNQAVALCYCLGLLPLFPYDVWTGPDAPGRWYGAWEQYRRPYEVVREHPEWFDEYECECKTVRLEPGRCEVISRRTDDPSKTLSHVIGADGTWETTPV